VPEPVEGTILKDTAHESGGFGSAQPPGLRSTTGIVLMETFIFVSKIGA
jgi:hypothetical protein